MNTVITADRPTGKLHIGHFVGSIRQRVVIQNDADYDQMFIMQADAQALTDNADNPQKIRENLVEIVLDNLACGIDPEKSTLCVQSNIYGLSELYFYFANLVTVARLKRNPTVKSEITQRGFDGSGIPVGFFTYPISQAADIAGFKANIVPVGEDQLPMLEQCNEIVHKFNSVYGETLREAKAILPGSEASLRLPGIDGKQKMSKSLGNCIFLADDAKTVKEKVMSMFTDPDHLKVSDPGKLEGNTVFTYLDALSTDRMIQSCSANYHTLDEVKAHYTKGGLGDVTVKKILIAVLEEILQPIRERRHFWEQHIGDVFAILHDGTKKANAVVNNTLQEVRHAMRIDYFDDPDFLAELKNTYHA